MVDGMLSCSHCDTTLVLPTPSVLTGTGEAEVYMDHEAIQDELNRFKNKHQDCPHKAEDCNHPDLMGAL